MSKPSRFRFSLKRLMLATALVAIGLWLVPEIVLELKWRTKRQVLVDWAEQLDRRDGNYKSHSVEVGARLYFMSTMPAYMSTSAYNNRGWLTHVRPFPEQQEFIFPLESPSGTGAGFFIIPQCVWVESPEEAVRIWKRTTDRDWDRYHSISPSK